MEQNAVPFSNGNGDGHANMVTGPTVDGHVTFFPSHTTPLQAPTAVTGTCTNAYVEALAWACQLYAKKKIIVVNTHATYTMKYRVRGYAKAGSSYYEEIFAETTLAAESMQPINIEQHFDEITVEVIQGSNLATYAIDYCGGS